MNNLDKKYLDLVQDILDNGHKKETRNGGTISVFGRQIRHKMSEGFPLLTTKKMHWKSIATELVWFLRGETNIKWLLEQGNTIWVGDAYKNYLKHYTDEYDEEQKIIQESPLGWMSQELVNIRPLPKEEFINKIKTDDEFAKKWGELGPIYGAQWRHWQGFQQGWNAMADSEYSFEIDTKGIDQIATLINDLKTTPDSRRMMVNAWNVGELDDMTLPPCHYGFQLYTRELPLHKRLELAYIQLSTKFELNIGNSLPKFDFGFNPLDYTTEESIEHLDIPKRAISLMWNQRSVDVGLGLPFNIASYGLLLEIIAKAVNMVPDELIGNLGDTHLYLNHVEPIKEQFGRELDSSERVRLFEEKMGYSDFLLPVLSSTLDFHGIPKNTREPFPLPTLSINTEFWPTESGECGVGPIDAVALFNSFDDDNFCKCLLEDDIQLVNYQSHPAIKLPLSN